MPISPHQYKSVPHWQSVNSINTSLLQEIVCDWLLDNSSLTLRIKEHCRDCPAEEFSVRVLSQMMTEPLNDEVQRLQLNQHDQALIREVLLYCGKRPLIYARSVIPAQTLTGEQQQLGNLGNRPLGEFLFSQPDL